MSDCDRRVSVCVCVCCSLFGKSITEMLFFFNSFNSFSSRGTFSIFSLKQLFSWAWSLRGGGGGGSQEWKRLFYEMTIEGSVKNFGRAAMSKIGYQISNFVCIWVYFCCCILSVRSSRRFQNDLDLGMAPAGGLKPPDPALSGKTAPNGKGFFFFVKNQRGRGKQSKWLGILKFNSPAWSFSSLTTLSM